MSDPDPVSEAHRLAELRRRAASRLTGAAADKGRPEGLADALSALYTLAVSPRTAPDALALLHELQVHQVELDLQAQELHESREELESALRLQASLFAALPVACFTVDERLVVHSLNRAGSALLGADAAEGPGFRLDSRLTAQGADDLRNMVAKSAAGEAVACRRMQMYASTDGHRVQAHVSFEPASGYCAVVFVADDGDAP